MDFEPKQLVFRDVRLNQSYTTSLCITNPLNSPVEFTIRSSNSSRYSISPNQVQLQPKQSIVVTIRLFLNHYPVHHHSKGMHHHHGQEDSLHIKSVYFDQKLTIQFFLHSSMMRSSSPLSRSISPSGSRVRFTRNTADTADKMNSSDNNMMMIIDELKQQILDRDNRIIELQNTITALESKHPKWTEIIRSKVKQERDVFEERSSRIMAILQQKDENILALEKKLEESMKQQLVRNRSSGAASSSSSSTYSIDAGMAAPETASHRDKIQEQEAIISIQRKEIDDLLLLQRQQQQQMNNAGDDQSAASIALLRNDLVRAKDAIKTLQDKLSITSKELSQYKSTSSSSSSKLIPAVQLQELRGLREQTIDQSEQIEALVMELKKMRSEARDYGNLSDELTQARREAQRLREDATHRQQQHEQQLVYTTELQVSKSELERSYASLMSQCDQQQSEINQLLLLRRSSGITETINARSSTSDTHTTPLRRGVSFQGQQQQLSGQQPQQAATNSVTEQLLSSRIGPSSNPPSLPSVDRLGQLYMDGVAYESNIGGGDDDGEAVASGSASTGGGNIATSTPMNYSFRNSSSLKDFKVNEYNSELLDLYQDQLSRYEGEVAELQTRLEDTVGAERELRGQTTTLDDRLRALEQENRLLTDRLERTKSERDHLSTAMQAKEMELQDALQRIEQQVRSNDKDEAQVWWSYIWHALREQQGHVAVQQVGVGSDVKEATGDGGGGGGNSNNYPGSYDYKPPHETAQKAHDQRLRENLRSQAIEIATLRQDVLARRLLAKRETDALKEQIEGSQRELFHMQAQARVHRADKDVKIAELTSTIRALSARTDMHAQVVAARQEVETERLTIHHLRADVDTFRLLLEDEQRKLLQARKETANLQSQIDSTMVIQTVTNIPGVSAPTLIEMMAGQITYHQSEASRARRAHAEATAQLKKLQRVVDLHHHQKQQQHQRKYSTRQQEQKQQSSLAGLAKSSSNYHPVVVPSHLLSSSSSRRIEEDIDEPTKVRRSYEDTSEHALSATLSASPVRSNAINNNNKYSLSRPSDEDFRGPLDQSEAIVINDDDDDHEANAPYSLRTDSNVSNFSIIIDAEATPKQVIESLDRTLLVQRALEQEATINDLTELVDGLKADRVRVETSLLRDWDASDEAKHLEYETSQRRQELLRTQLNEYKQLLEGVKQRNLGLEKAMSDVQLDQLMINNNNSNNNNGNNNNQHQGNNNNNRQSNNSRIITSLFEQNYYSTEDFSTSSQASGLEISYEENKKELESMKILLRERTTQLKIVMETLDTLQVAGASVKRLGSRFDAEDEQLFNYRSSTNSIMMNEAPAYTEAGTTTTTTSWANQALIKRVVELTTELSSQHAIASIGARQVEDLELTNRRQSKECNRLRLELHRLEDASAKTLLQVNAVNNRLREVSREHIDAIAALRADNDDLTTKLREYEGALNESELRCSTLTQQAQLSEQKDFMTWLEFVALDNQKIISNPHVEAPSYNSNSNDGSSEEKGVTVDKEGPTVRELVTTLLTQWKEYVHSVPQFKPPSSTSSAAAGVSKLTKSEQRFLQKVTDLVVASNERAMKASDALRAVTTKLSNCEYANSISMERLKIVSGSLNRYRRRCSAFEKVLSSDQKQELITRGKLESTLKQSLSDMHLKHASVIEALRVERRDRMIQEVRRALEAQQMRRLQVRVAELEAKGSSTLRGRDEAIQSLESKLRRAEEAMHNWFSIELPRLISGLPVTEEAMPHFYTDYGDTSTNAIPGHFGSSSIHTSTDLNHISNKLMSSMGMDRCYALAQALCASQASQSVQMMRISGLTEVNSILKERVLTLEGVLLRWRDQIVQAEGMSSSARGVVGHDDDGGGATAISSFLKYGRASEIGSSSSSSSPSGSGMIGAAYGSDHVIQQIYSYVEIEGKLTAKVHELTSRVIELEEETIEMRGKYEQASIRATEMKSLVDVVMADEQLLKTKATQQLTKIRMELEDQHALELRAVRQSYEKEKHALISELKSVADAVEEAKLTTVESKAWEDLVASDERKNNEIDIEFGALERGIHPKVRSNHHASKDIAPSQLHPYPPYIPTPEFIPSKGKHGKRKGKHGKRKGTSSSSSATSSSDVDDDDDEDLNRSTSSDSSNDGSEDDTDDDDDDDDDDDEKEKEKKKRSQSKRSHVEERKDKGDSLSFSRRQSDGIEHVQREVERSRDQFMNQLKQGEQTVDDDDDEDDNKDNREVALTKQELTAQLKSIADGITALQQLSQSNRKYPTNKYPANSNIDTMAINRNLMSNHHQYHHPTSHRPVGDLTINSSSTHHYSPGTSSVGSSGYPDSTSSDTMMMHRQALIEVQIENLERVLELERRKHQETQFEVVELEQMLRVQQEAFKQLLDREQKEMLDRRRSGGVVVSSVNDSLSEPSQSLPDQKEKEASNSDAVPPITRKPHSSTMTASQPPTGVQQSRQHHQHKLGGDNLRSISNAAAAAVEKEDRTLWPSLSNLLEELLTILHELSMDDRPADAASNHAQSLVRTAISMAARVKLICASPLALKEWEDGDISKHLHVVDRSSSSSSSIAINAAAAAASTTEDNRVVDAAHPMRVLIDRVKVVENSFADDNIPDRHLYSLRDLRMRMVEVDKKLSAYIVHRVHGLTVERDACMLQLQEKSDTIKQMRMQQSEAISKMKQTYDLSLKQVQSSHEYDAKVASAEISQLRSQLQVASQKQSKSEMNRKMTVHSNVNDSIESVTRLNSDSELVLNRETNRSESQLGPSSSSSSSRPHHPHPHHHPSDLKASQEFNRMQRLLNITSDELEESRSKVVELEAKYRIDMEELSNQLSSFRQAHDAVVRDLERQIQEERHSHHSHSHSNHQQVGVHHPGLSEVIDDSARETYNKLSDKFHSLELKYQLKCSEYDAMLKSLSSGSSRMGSDRQDVAVPMDHSMKGGTDATNTIATAAVARKQKVIDGMEKEIDGLYQSLEEEREHNRILKAELMQLKERSSSSSSSSRSAVGVGDTSETVAGGGSDHPYPWSLKDEQLDPFSPATREAIITASGMVRTKLNNSSRGGAVVPSMTTTAAAPLAASKNRQDVQMEEKGGGGGDPFLDFSRDYRIPENLSNQEKTKMLIRRMNDMRRSSKLEIAQLKATLASLQGNVPIVEDNAKLKQEVSSLKAQVTQLKEDNGRKSKLQSDLKQAKVADEHALSQWKQEVAVQEDNCKRLQRSLLSKDAMIKDLRAKVEGLEHQADRDIAASAGMSSSSGLTNDVATMTAAELRTRLRASELERARNRTRLQALKDRIHELEAQHTSILEENSKLLKANEKVEGLKSSIVRKDTMVQTLKEQIERLHGQIEELKLSELNMQSECNKKIKQLQRQVDIATHAQQEMERELDLMRKRLTDATSDQLFQSSTRMGDVIVPPPPPALGQASWSKYNRSPSLRQKKTTGSSNEATDNMRQLVEGSSRRSAAGRVSSTNASSSSYTSNVTNDPMPPQSIQLSGIPIPLEESAVRNDLQDVITALGVDPQHLGLRVNTVRRTQSIDASTTASTNRTSRQQQQQQQQQSQSPPMTSSYDAVSATGMGMTRQQRLDESKAWSETSSSLGSAVDMSSVEKRLQDLVSAALESPVRQRRI